MTYRGWKELDARIEAILFRGFDALAFVLCWDMARIRHLHRSGWLYTLVFAGLAGLGIFWWPGLRFPAGDGQAVLYFLSAAAQVLGAILAISITIPLVLVQLASTYFRRIATTFIDAEVIGYLGLYIAATLITLGAIGIASPLAAQLVLFATAACLAALFPYVLMCRRRLSAETILALLARRTARRFGKGDALVPDSLASIRDAIRVARAARDDEFVMRGFATLITLVRQAYEADDQFIAASTVDDIVAVVAVDTVGEQSLTIGLLEQLRTLATWAIDRHNADALFRALDAIGNIGKTGIARKHPAAVNAACGNLHAIAGAALKTGFALEVETAVDAVTAMAKRGCEIDFEVGARYAAGSLRAIAKGANGTALAMHVFQQATAVEEAASEANMPRVARLAQDARGEIQF